MQRLECGELFEGCDAVVEAETTEEVLARATEHAKERHGVTAMDPATVAAVKGAIVSA